MVPYRSRLVPLLAFALGLCSIVLPGLEKTLELGKDRGWVEMASRDGLVTVPGRWGYQDLALAQGGYEPDGATELLLHFDLARQGDAAGAYRYQDERKLPLVVSAGSMVGAGGAAFQGKGDGVGVVAPAGGLFFAGTAWEDFTIELWIYPSQLSEGETVLSWEGGALEGAAAALSGGSGMASQSLRAYFRDRLLTWEIKDLFTLPGGRRLSFTLSGIKRLLPRAWHHHLLRFDARTGLLEYALDGVVEASARTTDTGRESGSIAVPMVGRELAGPLLIGGKFTGFIDELRVSRAFVEEPNLSRYPNRAGTAVSNVLDLGNPGDRINRIEAVYEAPGDSSIELSYRVSDGFFRAGGDAPAWVPLRPGADFGASVRGRFLQVMVQLYPDGARAASPRLSSLRILYEPNPPPEPPAAFAAEPGNGKVTLSWRRVSDESVRGYEVYYGESHLSYFGTGAAQGASPVDAGDATSVTITGLENGRLYYFAVAAYDGSEPRQRSRFSAEATARPSKVYP